MYSNRQRFVSKGLSFNRLIISYRMGKAQSQPQNPDTVDLDGENTSSSDRRFAYSLLEKLIQYLDVAAFNMKHLRPSTNYSRRTSFKTSTRDVKFFSKVLEKVKFLLNCIFD